MPTQLPEDARRRLEEGQLDLRHRCWYNVQRLHKWSGRLEREGPSGEELGWNEITAALRVRVRDLLGHYARELAALAAGEWWSLGLTGEEFKSRMAAILQSALADLKSVAKDADADLGLSLDIAPLVADINTGLQAWCEDYVERYGVVVGLYGTAEIGLGAPRAPDEIPYVQLGESTPAKDASGQAAIPTRPKSYGIGTAGGRRGNRWYPKRKATGWDVREQSKDPEAG